jgi:hypothetical protein
MTASIPIFASTGNNPTQGSAEVAAAALRGSLISDEQRLRFSIWFLANLLKGIGGTDYTAKMAGSATGYLRYDTTQALAGFDSDMVEAAEVFIYNRAAQGSGSNPSTAVNTWAASAAKQLQGISEDDLLKMRLLLLDKIFAIKF